MVHKPFKINNYEPPIQNTRDVLANEMEDKILGPRGMSFKNFKTDFDRLVSP